VGQNFSAQPAENRVTFDGVPATVVSASANRLVVKPGRVVTAARWVAVSVEVGRQTSNAMEFELVPSGTARVEQRPVIAAPTSVVRVGADLYVSSNAILSSTGGLYRVEPDGRTTRVVAGRLVPFQDPNQTRYEVPMFLATDGTDIWFTTSFNAVRRYHVATGVVSEIALLPQNINGFTRGPGGHLFMSAQDGKVQRISPEGEVTTISAPELQGAFGLWADGGDVFVANAFDGSVIRIANAEGNYTLTPSFTTSPSPGLTLAVVSGQLVLAAYDGRLFAANRNTGGPMEPFRAPAGYGSFIYGMWADADGALLLAQPVAGAVRRIAAGVNTATIAAAGLRQAFATVRMNDRWYFAGISFPTPQGGPLSAGLADGTVVELTDEGVSRIVARGGDIRGMVALGDGRLALSDCVGRRISTLNPATGEVSELLGAGDGLSCPTGLALGAAGELLYIDVQEAGATVGRRTSQGQHQPAFVTSLPREAFQLARVGGRLLVLSQGTAEAPGALYTADATVGGVASVWVPPLSLYAITSMGLAPSGALVLSRSTGELLTLAVEPRLLSPFGSALVFPAPSGNGQNHSLVRSMGFKPDGTLVMMDGQQYEVVTVTP
jgi:DNA-binding beta-propeller fold protein YncE